eukprot:2509332-Amphidinium_carterae.1
MEEVSRSFNKSLSAGRAWRSLLAGSIPGSVHRFQSLDETPMDIPPDMNSSTIKDLSTLRSSLASRYLQEQVTTTQRTPWYSPSPILSATQREDAAAMMFAAKHNSWDKLEKFHWVTLLAGGSSLAFRSTKEASHTWWFSLGSRGGMSVLAWPLHEMDHK